MKGSGLVIKPELMDKAADCRGTVRSTTKGQGDAGERRCCKEGKGPDPVRDYESLEKEETL